MEFWQASNGYNLAGTVGRAQPRVTDAHFSPKATLTWEIDPRWQAKLSFGEAWRFPTVSELYQIVATGPTYAVPNANLRPERVLSGEAVIERRAADSLVRLSLFQENTHDALISQMTLMNQIYVTTNQNVTEIRNRGVEFVLQKRSLFGSGLDLTNSVTYVDSRILSDPGFSSTSGTTATGKHVPYVPAWRDTLQLTWHATKRLDLTGALRYQGKMYSTLDNTDRIANVFGAFDAFLVADLHVHYDLTKTMTADIGVDNINNARYIPLPPLHDANLER
ncbi:TonB-dependent receptor [Gluconacetobacter aggeris]|uniref:TonB-dependent receptor n=1 Tax=Gluconacetobacter aggeris TaxID=1286186 RepID=UPI001FE5FB92|nr:TonB-dependent receptor [Gluconacetobacter aggeris]